MKEIIFSLYHQIPGLPWAGVGWRDRQAITIPIEQYLKKKKINFIAQRVDTIDATNSKLELASGETVTYDYLVITTGPRLAFEEVEGSGPEGYTQSICVTDHAESAWAQYQKLLEKPGPIVIGAMPFASCFGVSVLMIKQLSADGAERLETTPDASYVFKDDDVMLVMGPNEKLGHLRTGTPKVPTAG